MANARIWILDLGRSVRTALDGRFDFTKVPAGTYRVLAETELRAVANLEATITPGKTTETDRKSHPAPLSLIVEFYPLK